MEVETETEPGNIPPPQAKIPTQDETIQKAVALTEACKQILTEDLNCQACLACYSEVNCNLFQCVNGHIICHLCYRIIAGNLLLVECPTCKVKGPFIKARLLSQIGAKLFSAGDKFCRHFKKCGFSYINMESLKEHEELCQFNEDICIGCKVSKPRYLMFWHLESCTRITAVKVGGPTAPLETRIPILIGDIPPSVDKTIVHYVLKNPSEAHVRFVLSVTVGQDRVQSWRPTETLKAVIKVTPYFEANHGPKGVDFPVRIALFNSLTLQHMLFTPSLKRLECVLRSDEIGAFLGTEDFKLIFFRPLAKAGNWEEYTTGPSRLMELHAAIKNKEG